MHGRRDGDGREEQARSPRSTKSHLEIRQKADRKPQRLMFLKVDGHRRCMTYTRDYETENYAEWLVKIATALEADPEMPRYQMRDQLLP